MNILDVALAGRIAASGGGGGSGTDNYNDLSNLPQINGETLAGNKSSSNLGLQDEIDSDHKLSSDLVDDANHTNKFVTSTEKQTWSAKQNAIDADHKLSSDLVDDANKTNKFVTSTEKQTWNNKQNAIDLDHKLSSSLVSFTTAEAAALASGIDSAKVGQISTNQTNILYTSKTGAQNLIVCSDVQRLKELNPDSTYVWWEGNVYKSSSWTFTINGDGSITINGTFPTQTFFYFELSNSDTTRFKNNGIMRLTGCPSGGSENSYFICVRRTTPDYYWFDGGSGIDVNTSEPNFITSPIQIFIGIRANVTLSNQTFYPSLVLKTIYEQDSSFHIGALPNYDLTYLQAQDRAALAEVVDSGAKNLLQNVGTSTTIKGVTFTVNSDGSVSTYGTSDAGDAVFYINKSFKFQSGVKYVLSGCPSGGSAVGYRLCSMGATYVNEYGNGAECVGDGATREIAIYVKNSGTNMGTAQSPKKFYPMICTKAAFGVSKAFVPYRYDPYTTALQNISNSTTLYARRCGRVVTVNGYMDNISFTANNAVTIGTIDSSIGIPPNQVRAVCNVGSNAYSVGKQGYVTISSTDGQIKVTSEYSGTGAVYFSLSYII